MVIRRINPISAAKVQGMLLAFIGLLIGACVSLIMLAFGGLAAASDEPVGGAMFGMFGAGAIIVLPIVYGIFGFIGGLIWALLYNLVSKWTGGLEVEVTP